VAGESWKTDDKNHWKECTGCKEKIDVKGHSFGIWEITKDPTETEVGQMQRVCKECGKTETKELEGFRFVKGTTITGEESWTPSSDVFVPGRKLTIPDLIVSDHEVTRGEYTEVMGKDPSTADAYDKDGNKLEGDDVLNNPVNEVNWYDALVYCNKLSIKEKLTPCYSIDGSTNPAAWGEVPYSYDDPSRTTWDAATCNFEADGYRLPTEAEWEWLARGGENYWFAGSDNEDEVAWWVRNTKGTGTREVKAKVPNGYGLYDMSGNVFEWCWDRLSGSMGDYRFLRGGSWCDADPPLRVNSRNYVSLYHRCNLYGFRVVRRAN
jgi:formylglycine-generating enzyme required for sulfatase activity